MRLEERTYLDQKGMATTDKTQGVRLFGVQGQIVDDEAAERVGLKQRGKSADKMVRQPANKGMPVLSMSASKRTRKPITVPVEEP